MAQVYEMVKEPVAVDYVAGLAAIRDRVSEAHLCLWQAQYSAAERALTSTELAELAGTEGGHGVVNLLYGKLGHAFCEELGIEPDLRPDASPRWWAVWSRGWNAERGFVWQMLPQVAEALEKLGWVEPEHMYPEEVGEPERFAEGAEWGGGRAVGRVVVTWPPWQR